MINLMYHDISTGIDMSSGFQTQVSMDYKVDKVVFEEQVRCCKGKNIVFTFDDGGESFLTAAAPILEKYGFRGVFFISTNHIGKSGFLTAAQIKELDQRGHIIGSHTHSHPKNLSQLTYDEICIEWKTSVNILTKIIGKNVTIASIPNGRGSVKVTNAAKFAGIKELYTSEPTTLSYSKDGITLIGRYVVLRSMTTSFVIGIVESQFNRAKLRIKWSVINIFKSFLGKYYYNFRRVLVRK